MNNEESFVPNRKLMRVNWLLVVLAWIGSLMVLPWAPDQVPTHWGISGQVNGFMSPIPGLFILPAMMALLALLLPLLPRIDPRRQNYALFGSTYVAIQSGILVFLLALHLVMLAAALGIPLDMNRIILPMIGVLFVGLGNVMGKIRPNWFVGFRTPWALSSPDVWTRTHRFGGRLMVGLGLAMLISGLLLPPTVSAMVVGVGAGGMVVLTFTYSYLVWRRLGETGS
jgi:uncharacterized membrane protein